jgi:hypothetical protein
MATDPFWATTIVKVLIAFLLKMKGARLGPKQVLEELVKYTQARMPDEIDELLMDEDDLPRYQHDWRAFIERLKARAPSRKRWTPTSTFI